MSFEGLLQKSSAFVLSEMIGRHKADGSSRSPRFGPSITIAHQTGAGTREIAERLAQILQDSEPKSAEEWKVLDRQLIEKALEELHWPMALANRLPVMI
jgi:hypothetical protein